MSVDPDLETFAFVLFHKLWIRNGLADCTVYPAVVDSVCPDDFCDGVFAFQRLSSSFYEEFCEKNYYRFAHSRTDFFFFLSHMMGEFRNVKDDVFQLMTFSLAALTAEMGVACARRGNPTFAVICPLAFAMVYEEYFYIYVDKYDRQLVWDQLLDSGRQFGHVRRIADIVGRSKSLRRDLVYRLQLLRMDKKCPEDLQKWLMRTTYYGGFFDVADLDDRLFPAVFFPFCLERVHLEYLVYLKPLYAENFIVRNDILRKGIFQDLAKLCEMDDDEETKEGFCTLYEASVFGELSEILPQPEVTCYLSLFPESHDLDHKSMVASEMHMDDLDPHNRDLTRKTKEHSGIFSDAPSLNELYDLKPKDTESRDLQGDCGQEARDTKHKLEEHSGIISDAPSLNELYDLKPKDTESRDLQEDRGQEARDTQHKLEEHSEIICPVPEYASENSKLPLASNASELKDQEVAIDLSALKFEDQGISIGTTFELRELEISNGIHAAEVKECKNNGIFSTIDDPVYNSGEHSDFETLSKNSSLNKNCKKHAQYNHGLKLAYVCI